MEQGEYNPLVVNIQKIVKAIKYAQDNIKPSTKYKHSVIFWGYTGTGKSSTILTLNGQRIYGFNNKGPCLVDEKKLHIEQQIQRKKLNKENVSKNIREDEIQGTVFISNQVQSGTSYPASLEMDTSEYQDNVILWDTPGFADTQGITQVLINTYFITRLFKIEEKIKLIFTINFLDLKEDQKGSKFVRVVQTLTQALKSFNDYERSMGILVTKINKMSDIGDVYDLLDKNIGAYNGVKTQEVKNFFRLLSKRKIPIIIIEQPKIEKQDRIMVAKEVTLDYQNFKSEFYQLITQKLLPAKLPKMKAPGMEKEQKNKCKLQALKALKTIDQITSSLIQKLNQYIIQRFRLINFNQNIDDNKKSMQLALDMKQFIAQIEGIENKFEGQDISHEKMLEYLKDLFESQKYLFQCEKQGGKYVCVPIKQLKNLYIIIDFLSTIEFSDLILDYKKQVQAFLANIKGAVPLLKRSLKQQMVKTQCSYKQFLKQKFDSYFSKWPKQQFVENWKRHFRHLPAMFLLARKFNSHKDLLRYTNELIVLSQNASFQCKHQLEEIQELIEFNVSSKVCLYIKEEDFISQQLRFIIGKYEQKIKNYMQYDLWQKSYVEDNSEAFNCFSETRARQNSVDSRKNQHKEKKEEFGRRHRQKGQNTAPRGKQNRVASAPKVFSSKKIFPQQQDNYPDLESTYRPINPQLKKRYELGRNHQNVRKNNGEPVSTSCCAHICALI